MNINYFFQEIGISLKIQVFIQLFSCDNPRAISILNLSTGKANKYCRSCLTCRNNYIDCNQKRNVSEHVEILNEMGDNSSAKRHNDVHIFTGVFYCCEIPQRTIEKLNKVNFALLFIEP